MEGTNDSSVLKIEELTKELEFADNKNEELLARIRENEQIIENQRKEIEMLRDALEFKSTENSDALIGGDIHEDLGVVDRTEANDEFTRGLGQV